MKNKRGQVALWVIFGVALAALIAIIFIISTKNPIKPAEVNYDPQSFIRKCVGDESAKIADEILPHGGFLEPKPAINYNNISIGYICKNEGNYKSCVNQHPAFVNEIGDEISGRIQPVINDCFAQLNEDLNSKGIESNMDNLTAFSVKFAPNRIIISINKSATLNNKGSISVFNNWKIEVNHPIYNMAKVAIEIGNQEANYCYFEYVGFSMLYPQFSIWKKTIFDGSKIYTIKDIKSGKEMKIAVRGCVVPAGI